MSRRTPQTEHDRWASSRGVFARSNQTDIDAEWILANKVQGAFGAFLEPSDPIRLFEAIHDILRACPLRLSAAYMFRSACAIADFGRLLVRRSSTFVLPPSPLAAPARIRLSETLERILVWHTRPSLTLREISAFMNVREEYLSQLINRVSCHSFLNHLHAVRTLHAAAALADSRHTVEQIARDCGYILAPQLNRHFKHLLHLTPKRFRRVCDANLHAAYLKLTQTQLRNSVTS